MTSPVEAQPTETIGAEALFRAHASFVAGFLVRLGVRPSDLDDLMQEVFVVAHRRGGFQPGPARPTTWLARIAIRVAMAHRRTRMRQWGELDEEALHKAFALNAPALVHVPHGDVPSPWDLIMMPKVRG